MPSADVGRPTWHKPVLVLAILLVVGQVVAFLILRSGKKGETKPDAGVVATIALDAAEVAPTTPTTPTTTPTTIPTTTTTPNTTTPVDAAVEVTTAIDAAVETPSKITTSPSTTTTPKTATPDKKKPTRAELLAQQKKEREEKKREDDDRRRAEQQDRERKKIEQERAAAEQAKAAAELERQKLAAQKAEADAATAKAAAEKAKLEAAQNTTTVTPATPQGPDVLVLVLGPGTPSVSSDQIRNVYLGRTTVWPNGTTARPLNRPAGTTAARKFYGGILKMNAGAFGEHWSEIQLGGGGIAPATVSSGKVTVAKVAATTGGFGYVMESELPENTNGVRLVRLK
jgi:hypothetical protein